MQAQFAHTEILVKRGHDVHECMLIGCCRQSAARLTDPVTDPLVEHLAVLVDIFIIFQKGQTVDPQRLIDLVQIIVKQFLENGKVIQRHRVDAALHRAHDLTGHAERIFVIDQQICQIIVPQISLKAMAPGQLHHAVDAVIQKGRDILFVIIIAVIIVHDPCHIIQDLAVLKMFKQNQLVYFTHVFLFFLFSNNYQGSACCASHPGAPQVIFHRTVIEIALEIQEEPVFPVPALDGAGLNFSIFNPL